LRSCIAFFTLRCASDLDADFFAGLLADLRPPPLLDLRAPVLDLRTAEDVLLADLRPLLLDLRPPDDVLLADLRPPLLDLRAVAGLRSPRVPPPRDVPVSTSERLSRNRCRDLHS
jgi:hypothetical protein